MATHLRMKLHSGELLGNQKETLALTRVAMDFVRNVLSATYNHASPKNPWTTTCVAYKGSIFLGMRKAKMGMDKKPKEGLGETVDELIAIKYELALYVDDG